MTSLRKHLLWGGLAFLTAFVGALTIASVALIVGIKLTSLVVAGASAAIGALIAGVGGWRALRHRSVTREESCAY